jgi:hypothetical protein
MGLLRTRSQATKSRRWVDVSDVAAALGYCSAGALARTAGAALWLRRLDVLIAFRLVTIV